MNIAFALVVLLIAGVVAIGVAALVALVELLLSAQTAHVTER